MLKGKESPKKEPFFCSFEEGAVSLQLQENRGELAGGQKENSFPTRGLRKSLLTFQTAKSTAYSA